MARVAIRVTREDGWDGWIGWLEMETIRIKQVRRASRREVGTAIDDLGSNRVEEKEESQKTIVC